jgi:hypothetical protein
MVDDETARVHLRIVKGDPTPEELAALVAVLAGRGGGEEPAPEPVPVGAWSDRSRQLRRPLRRGPGAWRASGRPVG